MDPEGNSQEVRPDGSGPPEPPTPPVSPAPPAPSGTRFVEPPRGGLEEQRALACAAALQRGDFREARRVARELLAGDSVDAAERAFAGEVLRRTDVDRVALGIGVASFALFWLIVYLALWR